MAMSVEEINKKLEKVWKDLDKAIEKQDMDKVKSAIESAQKLNEKTEGESNQKIITELEEKIEQIAKDIHPDSELEPDERIELIKIKGEIKKAITPFKNIEEIVEKLSKESMNQEDLKEYKEQQKEENTVKIDALKENSEQLTKSMINIEMKYLEPIKNNQESIKILNRIFKEIDVIKTAYQHGDTETIAAENSKISSWLSELESKGVDISQTAGFEGNFHKLYTLNHIANTLKSDNEKIAQALTKDTMISPELIQQYQLDQIKDDKELMKKYGEMKKMGQKYMSKIRILQAENKQIDETIQMLDEEKELRNIAYNENGSEKSKLTVGNTVLQNQTYKDEIEKRIDNRFRARRGPFKNTRAKWRYYKEIEGNGWLKALWNAATHKTKKVKRLAVFDEAINEGKSLSQSGMARMQQRRSDFMETVRKETMKELSKDPNLTENDIKDNVVEKAYESALGEERG